MLVLLSAYQTTEGASYFTDSSVSHVAVWVVAVAGIVIFDVFGWLAFAEFWTGLGRRLLAHWPAVSSR